jgi:toxin ParE1/3/4
MRVRISLAARAELEAIGDYIAADSQPRAASFVAELLDRCGALSNHPERSPVATEFRGQAVRRATYRNYLIFYSIAADHIRVHHIVHSARDYMRLLFPED